MRALLALASKPEGVPVRAEDLARSEGLPVKFVENILVELRRAGIVSSQRGGGGGYRLARPASAITPADVIRALDGPLADVVGGTLPEEIRSLTTDPDAWKPH